VGSHVADELSQSGFDTTIFDQRDSIWRKPDQKIIVGDLACLDLVSNAVSGADVVLNFAALADIDKAMVEPLATAQVNILGNLNILNACVLHKVRRFVLASTVYVHSREGGFYRCSKQAAEAYVKEYNRQYDLDYTILRYGSLYGPRSGSNNGLWRIVKTALDEGTLSYNGSPESMREYIHVKDAARATVNFISSEGKNQSVVLTGQEPMRVHDLLKMLGEIMGISTNNLRFKSSKTAGHYVRTPYAFEPQIGLKYIPPSHIDLGRGLLELIECIAGESNNVDI